MSRPLLRLGRAGATETHGRSLAELAAAHRLVKVQVNGARDAALADVAAGLERHAGREAVLLQVGSRVSRGGGGAGWSRRWLGRAHSRRLPPHAAAQVKGSTLLFGARGSSRDELLAVAEAEAAGTALWKAKRRIARAERAEQRGAR